jgi:Putative auto-transporter adhesin, head GIN domain
MKNHYLIILLASSTGLSSCHHMGNKIITGNGIEKTIEYPVTPFTSIKAGSLVTVHLIQGPFKPVKLVADENLIPYIQITQEGSELIIKNKMWYGLESNKKVDLYVSAPAFRYIELSGDGDIVTDSKITCAETLEIHKASGCPGNIEMEVYAPKIDARVSGVGDLGIKGHTPEFDLTLNNGTAHCYGLLADNIRLTNTGIGDAEVTAGSRLEAIITSLGSINYKGKPGNVTQNIHGKGLLQKIEN